MVRTVTAAAFVRHPLRCAAGCTPERRFGEPAQVRRLAEIPRPHGKNPPDSTPKTSCQSEPVRAPRSLTLGGARTGSRRRTARGGACPYITLIARRTAQPRSGCARAICGIRRKSAVRKRTAGLRPDLFQILPKYRHSPQNKRQKNANIGCFRLDGFEKFCYSISI